MIKRVGSSNSSTKNFWVTVMTFAFLLPYCISLKYVFVLQRRLYGTCMNLCNLCNNKYVKIQKQAEAASGVVLRKRFSENIRQIYMRTPMPKCDSNKVAKFLDRDKRKDTSHQ